MPLTNGTKLGPYEIISPLGVGGMGEVYRATDKKLNRDVAIKVIPQEFVRDEQRLTRFEREAQLLAALNHTNIASIYGLEESSGGLALVMELVEGPILEERIKEGAIPVDEALPIAKQIAEALEYAHERGIVHRDLKPANIKLTHDGKVKVLDFGLAKALQDDAAAAQNISNSPTLTVGATKAGFILGTPAYMSPEQAKGKSVDRRADIWSFGVVFFEMLTGKQAFSGETVSDVLAKVIEREPDWTLLPASVPTSINRLLHRCLEKDIKRRLQAIGEARIVLSEPDARAESSMQIVAAAPAAATALWRRPIFWVVMLISAVIFSASGIMISGWLRHSPSAGVTRFSISLPAGQVLTGGAPAISRDGRFITYCAKGADGVSHLYVRALDKFESSEIPNSDDAQLPFFSPDGERIGFFAGGKLLTASRETGAPTPIADASYLPLGATWGDDDQIYYVPSLTTGIIRVAASGGKSQRVSEPDGGANGYAHVWPQYLFDTHSVLFTIWAGQDVDARGTAVLSPQTGKWTRGVGSTTTYSSSQYALTGHLINSGARGLTASVFDPTNPQQARTRTFVVDDVFWSPNVSASWFSMSDTGTLVYVPGDPSLSTPAWVDRAGTVTSIGNKPQSMSDATLSPDGTRVVVIEETSLWIWDLRRGTKLRLTQDNEGSNQGPMWSRDGTQIIFASNRGNDWDIYSVPASGGPAKHLLTRKGTQFPLSQAPGGTLLFSERAGGTGADLMTLAPDGTVAPFVVSPASKLGGQYSPDGRMVVYVSDETGHNEIYVRSVANSASATAVSSEGGSEPLWSRDGKEVFYRRGDVFMSVGVNLTGDALSIGDTRKLFEMRAATGRTANHAGYAVSPDGKQFLILRPDPRAIPTQINVVLNWFDELKAKVPAR